jgi:hypothetical protein
MILLRVIALVLFALVLFASASRLFSDIAPGLIG